MSFPRMHLSVRVAVYRCRLFPNFTVARNFEDTGSSKVVLHPMFHQCENKYLKYIIY